MKAKQERRFERRQTKINQSTTTLRPGTFSFLLDKWLRSEMPTTQFYQLMTQKSSDPDVFGFITLPADPVYVLQRWEARHTTREMKFLLLYYDGNREDIYHFISHIWNKALDSVAYRDPTWFCRAKRLFLHNHNRLLCEKSEAQMVRFQVSKCVGKAIANVLTAKRVSAGSNRPEPAIATITTLVRPPRPDMSLRNAAEEEEVERERARRERAERSRAERAAPAPNAPQPQSAGGRRNSQRLRGSDATDRNDGACPERRAAAKSISMERVVEHEERLRETERRRIEERERQIEALRVSRMIGGYNYNSTN
jgi:hypothetical protein